MKQRDKATLYYQASKDDTGFEKFIKVTFLNPEELSQSSNATVNKPRRNPLTNQHFERVTLDDFSVTLFIDTSEEKNPEAKNAKTEVEKLHKILHKPFIVKGKEQKIPLCRFVWGNFLYEGYCTRIQERYTLFSNQGYPLRAEASLTLQSTKSAKKTRKEGNKINSRKFWTVRSGDRLDLIAGSMFDDPALWRPIAEANDILNPIDFPEPALIGANLIIPDVLGQAENEE